MPRRYTKEVEEICGALKFEGLTVPEIMRRLNNDQAGLGYPCPIKERRIYEHISSYEEKHGPPPDPSESDQTTDTIGRLKRRIIARIGREVEHYEKRRVGKLSGQDATVLKRHFEALHFMEGKELVAQGRLKKRHRDRSKKGKAESEKPETAIQRLAREEREAETPSQADNPSGEEAEPEGEGATYSVVNGMSGLDGEVRLAQDHSRPPPHPSHSGAAPEQRAKQTA